MRYLVNKLTGGRVLNIGVGGGTFEEVASKQGADVYSLDPSEKAISVLADRLGMKGKAKVGHSQNIPFKNEFFQDVVISEVIEHLPDRDLQKTLEEVQRVLIPGGRIIGTVPANERLSDQFVICPHCGDGFHRWGHVQGFNPLRIAALLGGYFKVEEISTHLFLTWSLLNWKGKILGFVKKLLFGLGVHGNNEIIVFVGIKP